MHIENCFVAYSALGLPMTASSAEIKAAFFKLSKENHPDRNSRCVNPYVRNNSLPVLIFWHSYSDKNAHARYTRITEAYTVLKDPIRRRDYNETLSRYVLSYNTRLHPLPHRHFCRLPNNVELHRECRFLFLYTSFMFSSTQSPA